MNAIYNFVSGNVVLFVLFGIAAWLVMFKLIGKSWFYCTLGTIAGFLTVVVGLKAGWQIVTTMGTAFVSFVVVYAVAYKTL